MNAIPGQAELEALAGMLDETDETIYQTLRQAVLSFGEDILPYLEKAHVQPDRLRRERIDGLIAEIRAEAVCRKLSDWKNESDPELLRGFYLFSSAFYPDLSWEKVCEEFNRLDSDCRLMIGGDSLSRKLVQFNNFFFNQCRFKLGSKIASGYDFADFFLPNLMNLRQGNDRSLSIAYRYLAQRNELPVFFLSLPVINLLACTGSNESVSKDDVCLCIDMTHQGTLIKRHALEPVFSRHTQIQIGGTVQALQEHAGLLLYQVSKHEKDPEKRRLVKRLHNCLGLSSNDFDLPFPENETED